MPPEMPTIATCSTKTATTPPTSASGTWTAAITSAWEPPPKLGPDVWYDMRNYLEELTDEEFEDLIEAIEEAQPDLEIDSHRGEQPLYPVIFSIE